MFDLVNRILEADGDLPNCIIDLVSVAQWADSAEGWQWQNCSLVCCLLCVQSLQSWAKDSWSVELPREGDGIGAAKYSCVWNLQSQVAVDAGLHKFNMMLPDGV